ncbi:MAG TPA: GspMb/PilO family protein [Caulobacteraceae bacterium]|nr:GspMb/PilO family protein [Caulobacteraceae bacterium]
MIRKGKFTANALVGVPAVVGITALAMFLALWLIAQPSDLTQRMARIDQQTALAETVLTGERAHGYLAGAVCQDARTAPDLVRQRLKSAAVAKGLALANVSAAPGAPNEAIGGLEPISLAFEASGPYDAVIGLLGALAQAQPQVFADTVDLKSQVSSVSLKFTGRLFCSTTARL